MKILYGIIAFLSFTSALALGTKLRFDDPPGTPTENFQELLEWEAESIQKDPYYEQQFIRTGPPDSLYNCHGWTFAGGKKVMNDGEVQKRLRAGRYHKVSRPEAGDVVLYYDSLGNLCHSGLVKATGKDKFVLVESKWGTAGRFLHLVDLPKVHVTYSFFRQRRGLWTDSADAQK